MGRDDRPVSVEFKKSAWQSVKSFFSFSRKKTNKIISDELKDSAEDIAETVRTIILKQQYKWVPLSERYLAWKKKKKLDQRILIATHEYVNSIQAIPKEKKGKTVAWSVGPGHPDTIHKPSKMRLHDLARLLEYGTRRMPARPHWRPAWGIFIRRNKKLRTKNIIKSLTEALKRGK